jgi:hypothetical protein
MVQNLDLILDRDKNLQQMSEKASLLKLDSKKV